MWSEIASALAEPERLIGLAGDALGHSAGTVDISQEDLGALDRKIDGLERKVGTKFAELINEDFDPAAIPTRHNQTHRAT